jgi:IclR family KDG regulon transcriptional repressor
MKGNRKKRSVVKDLVEKESSVQSVRRAADILECVGDGFNSVTKIAAKCNLHKSTVHRLLRALGESKLVIQNPFTRKYYPGYRFVKLSLTPVTTHEFLINRASEEMLHLSNITGETIDLRIQLGVKNIGLCLVQSKYDLITVGDSLRIRPVNIGVDGRVLLSQLGDIELASILEHINMETILMHKRVDIENIMEEVTLIRQRGYGVVHNELIKGVTCICTPVKNYIVPAALSIVGPEKRMKPKINDFTEKLLYSSALISKYISEYHNNVL